MFSSGKAQQEPVVVVRDSREVLARLRQALESADPAERSGMERALEIAEATAALADEQVRRAWVRGILEAAGANVERDLEAAVKSLRQAVPSLSLTAAYQLVKDVADHAA
ncbi:hypothetical protein [Streptomyces natalensis]|uniref:Uncharacterized protein n=1 Tax=Streptomyces natalensis ATCC 27448 TaxID=1240678 RepID=A0A0D7CTP3_9ACTN|nr:hypothetical protein [Streptomyces natalensis]KIZ19205.1 hypothetical protein SNA_01260 [Streptomyces natalensis ATCC 27448]